MTASPDDYFLEIEGHFAMRRLTPFILSAKDWALMKKWREEEIPLAVVLEAIDQVFEKNETSGRRKTISSLSYCRHAVKELWNDRKELYVGSGDASPEENHLPILEALAAGLEALPLTVEFAVRVRALAAEKTIPRIEERLIDLEHEMITSILDRMPAEAESIRAEVAQAVAHLTDEKARHRTAEANLRRLTRERFELPRLTLFR
jgi:hypothetical protein